MTLSDLLLCAACDSTRGLVTAKWRVLTYCRNKRTNACRYPPPPSVSPWRPPPPPWPAVHAALSRDRYVLNQCCITVGPASATLVQHKYNIGWMSRVCGQYSLRILDGNHLVAGENSWHHSILGSRHTPPLLSNIPSLVLPFNWPNYSRYVLMASRVYCGSVSGDDWAASSSH